MQRKVRNTTMKEWIYCFICGKEFEASHKTNCPNCGAHIWGDQMQTLADRELSQYNKTEKTQEVNFRWAWRRRSRRRI